MIAPASLAKRLPGKSVDATLAPVDAPPASFSLSATGSVGLGFEDSALNAANKRFARDSLSSKSSGLSTRAPPHTKHSVPPQKEGNLVGQTVQAFKT
jgi:hypothetical protein